MCRTPRAISSLATFAISTLLTLVLGATALPTRADELQLAAGWDFSQYFGDGYLTIDGASFVDTLDANYSTFDPTFGAGAESAAFGTMYINGQFGSSPVVVGTGLEEFIVTSLSLASNIDAPATGPGLVPFDSFTVLTDEGQVFANPLSMTAADAVSVVFQADLSSIQMTADNWFLSFGAQTFAGEAQVGIEFSTDGASYTPVATADVTTVDGQFDVDLGAATSDTAFVRFVFPAHGDQGDGQAIIDNVAIFMPEPDVAGSIGAVLLGLGVCLRRRA